MECACVVSTVDGGYEEWSRFTGEQRKAQRGKGLPKVLQSSQARTRTRVLPATHSAQHPPGGTSPLTRLPPSSPSLVILAVQLHHLLASPRRLGEQRGLQMRSTPSSSCEMLTVSSVPQVRKRRHRAAKDLPRPAGECGPAEIPTGIGGRSGNSAPPHAGLQGGLRSTSDALESPGLGVPGHDAALPSTEHVLRARPCKLSSPPRDACRSPRRPEAGVGLPC